MGAKTEILCKGGACETPRGANRVNVQSSDQLGFTKKITYLMTAVERGECQRHALDTKQTCFGVSFDGKAAFPSVDRDILVRELYSCGERGDLLEYSNNI